MNDSIKEVIDFANNNPSSWFATSAENQPYVRGMLLWFADETGFYYHTAASKRMCSQIAENPRVSLAFIRNQEDAVKFETLHVSGNAEIIYDEKLIERLQKERAWLWQNIANSKVDTKVCIIRITNISAYIWNMMWNVRENEIPVVTF